MLTALGALLVPRWSAGHAFLSRFTSGLAGLYALNRSVLARRSARLAEIASWTLGCALLSLAAWSLWNGEPGLTVFATGAAATGLRSVLIAMRSRARRDGDGDEGGVGERLARYGVLVFCAVTLAYAPRWPAAAWATQFSLGLVVLAALWTELRLAFLDVRGVTRAAVLLDGGLLVTALAIPVALGAWCWQNEPAALPAIMLVIAGALFFRQGLALYSAPTHLRAHRVENRYALGGASTPSSTRQWRWMLRLAAEPKRWMSVTAPLWASVRLSPACYFSSLGMVASIFTGASPFFLSIPISLAAAFDRSISRPLA